MAFVNNIIPAAGTTINTGSTISFDVNVLLLTECNVYAVGQTLTELVWSLTGGPQSGYEVEVNTLAGLSTFSAIKRTSGWFTSPLQILVERIGPSGTDTESFSYNVGNIDLYPEGMRPYNEQFETGVDSVFGRTGDVIAQEGDYDLEELGDVDLAGLADNYILVYDAGTGNWMPEPNSGGGGGTPVTVQDEGVTLTSDVNLFNFVGAGVTVTEPVGDQVEINIPGGGGAAAWGSITGTLSAQTDLNNALGLKVEGALSATDNAVARFNLSSGKIIKNSGVIIDNSDNVTGILSLTAAAEIVSTGGNINCLNGKLLTGHIETVEKASPGTPLAGRGYIYSATDGTLHYINDAGTDTELGDVSGPVTATDNGIVRFDGTTGKVIQGGSFATISDTGVFSTLSDVESVVGNLVASNGEVIADQATLREQASTPTTPASGEGVVWVKNDGTLHFLNDAGSDTELGAGGGGAQKAVIQFSGLMGCPNTANWYTSILAGEFYNDLDWDSVMGANSDSTPIETYMNYVDGLFFIAPAAGDLVRFTVQLRPLIAQEWDIRLAKGTSLGGLGGTFTEIAGSTILVGSGWQDLDLVVPASPVTLAADDGIGMCWTISDVSPTPSDLAARIILEFEYA